MNRNLLALALAVALASALAACGLSPELELDNRSSQKVSVRYDANERNEDGSVVFRDVSLAPGEKKTEPLADGQSSVLYDYEPRESVKATESEGFGGVKVVFEDR